MNAGDTVPAKNAKLTSPSDLALAERVARQAGERLLSYYGELGREGAQQKGGLRRDLVSRADLEAEKAVIEGLPASDAVLSEEEGTREAGGERQWIVDPLDGTVNFLHQIPLWAVSIALVENGRLRLGVVHAPALGQTFTAVAGRGARVDGRPLRVSPTAELGDAILASGFAYRRNELADNNLDNWRRLALASAGLRRMGSAALDLAFVAAGHLDGFWEMHLNAWDVAAGTLLVREAGGRVTDFGGSENLDRVLFARHIVASNRRLHSAISDQLAPLRDLD